MRAEKNLKSKPPKKTRAKILKLVLVVAVFLIVLVFLLAPVLVSSEKGRKIILTKINNALGGKTDFARLSMGWFKGIKVTDFSFNDSAGQTSVQVKQIATKPHYVSCLTGNLSFGETIIDQPKVQINLKAEQITKEVSEVSAEGKPQAIALPIKKIDLIINDGNLKITDRRAQTVELSQINSKVNLRPPGRQTNFALNMTVADKGKQSQVQAAGQISPGRTKTGWTLKGTTGDLTIEVNDLNLQSLAPLLALAGIDVQAKGVISADIDSEIKDGWIKKLTAEIKGKDLDVTAEKLKGDRFKTTNLDVAIELEHKEELIKIDKLRARSDWAKVTATGVVPATFKSLTDFLQPDSNYSLEAGFDCDVAAVSSQMPKTLGLKQGTEITAGRLSGNIQTSTKAGQRKIQGQATLSGLQGTVEGKKIALSQPVTAVAKISSDKAGIKFDKLDVSAPFARVNCSGTTELLNYNTDVDLAKLQSELGQFIVFGPYKMAGELLSKGQLSIKEDKIATVGSSIVKNLVLTSEEKVTASEPAADIAFAFDIERKENIITIDSIKANATLGQVTIKDAVLPLNKKAAKPIKLSVSASNVDLQKLQPFAVLFASFPKQMQLAGIANSDIFIDSKDSTYTVTTDSTKIKNLKVTYPGQTPFEPDEVSLAFDVEINPQQRTINVKKLRLESPQIKIRKGELKHVNQGGKTKLAGSVDCEYDWSAVSTIAAPYLPKGLQLQGKRKDAITFTSEYPTGQTDKLLANLSSKAKFGFDKASYMGLSFNTTEVDIQIQNGLLNIAPFSTTVNNGRLNFAARIDLKQKPMVLQTTSPMQIIDKVEINEQVSRNLLVYLNPIFKDQADITGIANFHSEKLAIPLGRDTNMHPEIIGTVGIENMKLETKGLLGNILSRTRTGRSIDAAVLPTKFVLRKGELSYDNMQINLDRYPTNFNGSIGPNRILNMKVKTPYVLTKDFKLETVKISEATTAERITLPLIGTIDRPELDWSKLMEELLKQQLRQRLREGLDELFK